jgi:hypothetical protein
MAIAYTTQCGLKLAGKYIKLSVKGMLPTLLAAHPKDIPLVTLFL